MLQSPQLTIKGNAMPKYAVKIRASRSTSGGGSTQEFTIDAPDTTSAEEIAINQMRRSHPNDDFFELVGIKER